MGTREKVRFKRGMANLHRVFAVIDYILLFVVIWLGFGTNWALRTYTFCDYFPQILGILAGLFLFFFFSLLSFFWKLKQKSSCDHGHGSASTFVYFFVVQEIRK